MGWVSRGWGGSCRGCQRAATPGCDEASICGMVRGVVRLMMGVGVQTAEVRPETSCFLMKESPGSLLYYRFWPWVIAGRGGYPRRTRRNKQGLRDPPWGLWFVVFYKHKKNCKNCKRKPPVANGRNRNYNHRSQPSQIEQNNGQVL